MKLLIINGNPSPGNALFEEYTRDFISGLRDAGHQVRELVLRNMKIKPCTGCFACWVKTPGTCSIDDDGRKVAREFIASDHVIIASPLIMGFVSALTKNAFDRNIPLVHPHLEAVDGETHHKKRYDRYPAISFLLQRESFTDDEDISIVTDIFNRESINLRSTLGFIRFIDTPVKEVLDAIDVH